MSKKKKKNKKKVNSTFKFNDFTNLLEKKSKKITILKNGKKISLKDATNDTVEECTCSPLSGIIAMPAKEIAVKKTNPKMIIDTRYADTVFSLYEFAMKHFEDKQTICLTVTDKEAEYIFDYGYNSTITSLLNKTNINLVLSELNKQKNKIKKWLKNKDVDDGVTSMILNIPNVVLFTGNYNNIASKDVTPSVLVNVMIQIVKTDKSLSKLKNKNPEKYNDYIDRIISDSVDAAIAHGNINLHINLDPMFCDNIKAYADSWSKYSIAHDANSKLFNMLVFSTTSSNDFISFSHAIKEKIETI